MTVLDNLYESLAGNFSVVPVEVAAMRLVAAALLAGLIGWERERREKPAGLRTHILVAVAACLFMVISQEMAQLDFGVGDDVDMQIDPLRLIEAVTAGVAFLAAGIIFTSGERVRNITTGASMWLAGAIGLACGTGLVLLAALATGLVIFILAGIRQVERFFDTHDQS